MSQSLNTGITVPALPRNERAYAFGLDALPATFGEGFGAQFDDQMVRNPTASIGRMLDRAQYFPSTDEFGNETPARTPSRILTPQEANDQYGIPGHLKFDADTPEPIAQELKALKTREVERQDVMRRAQAGLGTALTAGVVASVLDPLNVASAFIPVVGEARYAAMVARLGVTGARATRGAIEGAVGAAVVEPFTLAAASYEQADYDAADSLASIAFGTALGSGLHMGGGAVVDRITARKSASSFERAIDDLPPADKEALLKTSVAQVAEGRPVDVNPVLDVSPRMAQMRAEEKWVRQTDTPEFKSWFGKSKVVSEDGSPMVVYHGTQSDVAEFQASRPSPSGIENWRGVYVSPEPGLASSYALHAGDTMGRNPNAAPNVMPLFMSLKNPLVIPDFANAGPLQRFVDFVKGRKPLTKKELDASMTLNDADIKRLQDQGYDGIMNHARKEYIAFEPTQLKSAIGNSGAFDPASGSLTDRQAAVKAKLAEAAAGPRVRMEPEGERFLADIERRFSEVQARPEAVADELKAVEAEMVELDRLLPADSEAKATTPAMQEANVYAKAWEAAVACRVGKA